MVSSASLASFLLYPVVKEITLRLLSYGKKKNVMSSRRKVEAFGLVDKLEKKSWRREEEESDSEDEEAEVIDKHPDIEEEETDLVEKRRKMQKLLADYPLVVNKEDPNWPEDADGWGFSFNQFFNKITIKNEKKDSFSSTCRRRSDIIKVKINCPNKNIAKQIRPAAPRECTYNFTNLLTKNTMKLLQ